jgi:hypothetical protein
MLVLLAAPLAVGSCSDWTMYLAAQCSDPVGVGDDPSQLPRACSTDDAGSACECVGVPSFWNGPTWLWQGATEQAPSCDGDSFYVGYTDFVGGGACELCTCASPTGTCALPSQLTVSTKACNIPGGSSSSFDAPIDWDGQCDSSNPVPIGIAHSLTVAPLIVMENECLPGPPVPAKLIPAKGTTVAVGCHGQGWSVCGDVVSSACVPHDDVPRPGFRLCILKEGDHDCPPTFTFTEKHTFYEKAAEECLDCSCGPPEGSVCKATLSVYQDGTCSGPPVEQLSIGSTASTCVDVVPAGQALASKSAGPPVYLPGACQPQGGQASGVITGTNPATICCRP